MPSVKQSLENVGIRTYVGLRHIFNGKGSAYRQNVLKYGKQLIRGLEDNDLTTSRFYNGPSWADMPVTGLLVIGGGEVAGALAKRTAEAVIKGAKDGTFPKGGSIYLVGGKRPWDMPFAKELINAQHHNHIPAVLLHEREGEYMEKMVRKFISEAGLNPEDYDIQQDSTGGNAQENIRNAIKLGAGQHERLALIDLSYFTGRTMGTWNHEVRDLREGRWDEKDMCVLREKGFTEVKVEALKPMPAWVPECGTGQHNWWETKIGCAVTMKEAEAYILPTPETALYVQKGFCDPVDLKAEYEKARPFIPARPHRYAPIPPIPGKNGTR